MYSAKCELSMLSSGDASLSKTDTVPDLVELPVLWRKLHGLCGN